jgi:hypothetical protein
MATWQFNCVLVPRRTWQLGPITAESAMLDGSKAFWAGQSAGAVAAELRALGEPKGTWSPDLSLWGAEDGTCLTLFVADDEVEELRLRVDMRGPLGDLLPAIVAVARKLELVLVAETGATVEPRLGWLLKAARASPAAAFVEDPAAFLDALARDPIDEEDPWASE